MASDESDDEPLSVIAAAKKSNPHKFESEIILEAVEPKKRKLVPSKKSGLTIKINRKLNTVTTPVIERPADVWLYLKDLNPTGPYKCLLCSDWFINRAKMIIHYVLNHKKDFCGICRYFVPDRETWWQHVKFHTPWPCSQCVETFQSEAALRQHLSTTHKLVHCRLCHFRVPVGDQYDKHLFQKHNVTNVNSKEEESLWEFDVQGLPKFNCYLCSKLENLTSTFFNHYMGYHHFTLKCLASFISGKDAPFSVNGADVSSQFIDGQLKGLKRFGYVDLDQKLDDTSQDMSQEAFLQDVSQDASQETSQDASQEASQETFQEPFQEASQETSQSETNDSTKVVDIEVKSEVTSENEEPKPGKDESDNKDKSKPVNPHLDYKGDEDFDITLAELVILEKCYFDYISQIMSDLAKKTVPEISNITILKRDTVTPVDCPICHTKCPKLNPFINHMSKMHGIKSIPSHTCRVCATTFETNGELESHITEELGEFEDLWICQFCDKEFDNRKETRKHLSEHWEMLEYDNCFSPHLGFKCRYCPTLFWNETDRETHQVRVHLNKLTDHFYKCNICSITFSDKVWFIHHHMEKHANESEQPKVYLLKCCLCCVVLTNIDEMRSHFDEHHPEARKLFCSLPPCKYKPLSHRKSFKLHVKTMHGPCSRTEKVNCSVCGREFPSSRSCNAHVSQVHGPGKFKCKLCKVVLHTMDERKLHYLLCHPGRHPFECTECGKSFQYKSSLYMHKQEHQPNKQSYTCSYCGKVFVKKDSYREHVQIHEGPRHACSYCPMRFVQRSNMLRHERRHTGERPYACPHCPRTFADKGACTSHARTHSKDTSYACLYCGQTFVQKSKLTYHIRKHTGENLETCTICSKLFTSACALREHMKIHLCKKESVQCPLCDKKYQDERYMLRHLRTSHTRAQFTCPLCRKVLTSAAGLRHHVITHSSLNTFRCKVCPKSYAVKRTIIKHLRRRHMLNSEEINLKDYYTRLEPRECELKLDEETMTSIFGPPKKKVNDILIGDFVTYSKNLNLKDGGNDEQSEAGKDSDSDDESQRDDENEQAGRESANEELEPTDFVSVKIEPLDDYEFTE